MSGRCECGRGLRERRSNLKGARARDGKGENRVRVEAARREPGEGQQDKCKEWSWQEVNLHPVKRMHFKGDHCRPKSHCRQCVNQSQSPIGEEQLDTLERHGEATTSMASGQEDRADSTRGLLTPPTPRRRHGCHGRGRRIWAATTSRRVQRFLAPTGRSLATSSSRPGTSTGSPDGTPRPFARSSIDGVNGCEWRPCRRGS